MGKQMRNTNLYKKTCVIILAGGKGTRIQTLYPDTPKPMIPVSGKPFIEWVIHYYSNQGLDNYVISLGHLAQVAEEYLLKRPIHRQKIKSVREVSPLGTGGGFMFAQKAAMGYDPLILTNGDSLVLADLSGIWPLILEPSIDGVIVGVAVDDASRFGTLKFDKGGILKGFKEKQPGIGVINAGIYCFKRRILSLFPKEVPSSLEHEVFPMLIENGAQIAVYNTNAPFLDIGTPESLKEAEKFINDYFK